jgi:hypothetical protein
LQAWTEAAERPTWTPIDSGGGAASADSPGFAGRVRRPSSLLRDTPIPERASALRHSLGEKIASVTHHGDSPDGGGVGADPDSTIPASGARELPFDDMIERARVFAADRPEVVLGAAFAGGLVLATILKRLAR